ncbi:hypothetical protein AAFN75_09570 [Algibacter sp. AS12]|uniref:hypothetical protein n=1 Tax=Algibacter sp. AS12 TaxID=3135773 RepID=UPI00398B6819
MSKKKERERNRLELTMSRIDHYYDSVNNKSAVYLVINTFLTGGLIVLMTQTQSLKGIGLLEHLSLGLCMLLGLVSLVIIAITSIPFFSTEPNSLYYFGTIGSKTNSQFLEESKNYTKKEDLKDLRCQVHLLSKGLTDKFKKLKFVGYFLVAQFIVLIPIMFYLIKNIS